MAQEDITSAVVEALRKRPERVVWEDALEAVAAAIYQEMGVGGLHNLARVVENFLKTSCDGCKTDPRT